MGSSRKWPGASDIPLDRAPSTPAEQAVEELTMALALARELGDLELVKRLEHALDLARKNQSPKIN